MDSGTRASRSHDKETLMTIRNFILGIIFISVVGIGFVSRIDLETQHIRQETVEEAKPTKTDKMATIISREGNLDLDTATQYALWVEEYADHHEVDPVKILAIMKVESGFNAKAHNPGDGAGLMQIVGSIHRVPLNKLLDPRQNIKTGVKIFAEYRNKSKSFKEALLRYNGTLGVSDSYARKVIMVYQKYQTEILMEV